VVPKPGGRWPSYNIAKQIVREVGLKSRSEYHAWWNSHYIQYMPLHPNRTYKDQWTGWNDFLGTKNKFGKEANNWRPYWDAVRWVQASEFRTWSEWRKGYDEGKVPKDIPKYPYAAYDEYDVNVWFGKTIMHKLELHDSKKIYWLLVRMEGEGDNVVWFLKSERLLIEGGVILRKWEYEEELGIEIWELIERMSSEGYEKEQRICPNIAQLIYEMDKRLLIIR